MIACGVVCGGVSRLVWCGVVSFGEWLCVVVCGVVYFGVVCCVVWCGLVWSGEV